MWTREAYIHHLKYDTAIGRIYRNSLMTLGLILLKAGRRCLKESLGRCSWCGLDPGFSSSVSRKGLRCNTLHRNCQDY